MSENSVIVWDISQEVPLSNQVIDYFKYIYNSKLIMSFDLLSSFRGHPA